jgi:tetratricopeptide (TPR) repeat protein
VVLAAIFVMLAIYWPVRHHQFVNYDDGLYVFDNPVVKHGLTWPGVQWAFTTLEVSNWHPLTWLSHMVDVELFGLENAGSHHIVSVFIHALNTVLLFTALVRLTGSHWRSAFVAVVFCLHPLRVESVAWIAERKDVLSAFFGLGSILLYAQFAQQGNWRNYALALLFFALSLMAKPMLVTLPCIFLLLDYWPLQRWNRIGGNRSATQLIVEKLPLVIMTAWSCWITVTAQRLGGSISPLEQIAIDERVQNAIVTYAAYLWKFLWPTDLAVLYPHPGDWESWRVALSAAVLLAISVFVAAMRRRAPALLTGWLWYLGTLVPVIGLVQVGVQAMADRYTYVPQIGLAIMLAWSLPPLKRPEFRAVIGSLSVMILVTLSWMTSRQVRYWRDSISLFERTISITSNNYIAHHNLAYAYEKERQYDKAIEMYERTLDIKPDYVTGHNNLGLLIAGRDPDAGVYHLRRAVELKPNSSLLRSNLGLALANKGLLDEAIAELERAVQIDPRDAQAHVNLGRVLTKKQKFPEAIDHYLAALMIESDKPDVHCDLGVALAHEGDLERAIAHFEAALKIQPDFEKAKTFRAKAIEQLQQLQAKEPAAINSNDR